MVRQAYFSWLGFLIAVTFNWFGALMALCIIDPNNGRLPGFLLANIYWFAGLPGAWILWQAPKPSPICHSHASHNAVWDL